MFGTPVFYKVKEIIEVVDNIIKSYDIKCYSKVSFADKKLVCGVIIKHQSDNKCTDWLDALTDNSGHVFSEYLIKGNLESLIEMKRNIEEKLVSEHENLMEEIFNERISHEEAS
jgi:hypothetical protein